MEKPLPAGRRRGACGQKLTPHALSEQAHGKDLRGDLLPAAETLDRRCHSGPVGTWPQLCFSRLVQACCSRLVSLEVKPPVRRYQWEKPGQMLHIDIRRLGKIDGVGHRKAGTRQVCRRRPGWEYSHVCIDDASRVACTAIHPDETAESAVEFLWHAVAWYTAQGMKVERTLTDNGACYKSRKFGEACREFGIQHKRTRPYRPQTNGKAERFIQTALKEWAYAQTHTHSWKRTACLSKWTHHYNFVRPHSAPGGKPPASCLNGE